MFAVPLVDSIEHPVAVTTTLELPPSLFSANWSLVVEWLETNRQLRNVICEFNREAKVKHRAGVPLFVAAVSKVQPSKTSCAVAVLKSPRMAAVSYPLLKLQLRKVPDVKSSLMMIRPSMPLRGLPCP